MRAAIFCLSATFLATPVWAAPDVAGNWLVENRTALVAIAPCGKHMCGTIAKILVNRPGVPTTDIRNPDPARRDRPFQGLRIISGMKPAAKRWEGGTIYDPNTGKSYKSHMQLNEDGSLKVSGCFAFICKSQRWTRAR
jgi:uncharacterized protein (DUF2147 family)